MSVPLPANSATPLSSPSTRRAIRPSLLPFHSSHRRPTGQAPSSPSFFSSEARASHVHSSEPPQPLTCPAAASRDSLPLSSTSSSTPFFSSSSTSSSRPVSRGRQRLRSSLQPNSTLASPRDLHSPQHSTSTVAPAHATPTSPSAGTTIHRDLCNPRPFAPRSSLSSTGEPPASPPAEDLDDFERRLTESLSHEFAQLALLHESTLLDKMNLARSFTKRLARPSSPDPNHATKNTRPQISMPMGLISTTNQWVHEVPNISDLHIKDVQQRQISSSSSDSSINGSDSETSPSSEPPSMTDTSSVESFNASPLEPNHLTPYFTPSVNPTVVKSPAIVVATPSPSASTLASPEESTINTDSEHGLIATPALPRRAPSHSKREHERLAHARSVSVRSSTISASERLALANHSQHNSLTSDASNRVDEAASAAEQHPLENDSRLLSATEAEPQMSDHFSDAFEQLDEVAGEYGSVITTVYTKEEDEDHRVMQELGLKSYRVSEYLRDIASFRQGLWDLIEEEEEDDDDNDVPTTPAWF